MNVTGLWVVPAPAFPPACRQLLTPGELPAGPRCCRARAGISGLALSWCPALLRLAPAPAISEPHASSCLPSSFSPVLAGWSCGREPGANGAGSPLVSASLGPFSGRCGPCCSVRPRGSGAQRWERGEGGGGARAGPSSAPEPGSSGPGQVQGRAALEKGRVSAGPVSHPGSVPAWSPTACRPLRGVSLDPGTRVGQGQAAPAPPGSAPCSDAGREAVVAELLQVIPQRTMQRVQGSTVPRLETSAIPGRGCGLGPLQGVCLCWSEVGWMEEVHPRGCGALEVGGGCSGHV